MEERIDYSKSINYFQILDNQQSEIKNFKNNMRRIRDKEDCVFIINRY